MLWGGYFVYIIVSNMAIVFVHALAFVLFPLGMLIGLVALVAWIYTSIMGFQGKDLRLPVVANFAQQLFATQLA